MTSLGALTFLNPWALAALLTLPLIWWLLRFTPPSPQTVKFPPFRLLLDLVSKEDESDKTPWWLILLRLALAASIIIAVATPQISNSDQARLSKAPLLIVIDNDWSVANNWQRHFDLLQQTIATASARPVPVTIAPTVLSGKAISLKMQSGPEVKARMATLAPVSLPVDYPGLLKQLNTTFAKSKSLQIIWLANGLANKHSKAFVSGLKKLAGGKATLKIYSPPAATLPVVLDKPSRKGGKITITAHRGTSQTQQNISTRLLAGNGRVLAEAKLAFETGKKSASAKYTLPLALRNEAVRIELSGQQHAGAVHLLDDTWHRKVIGISASQSLELAQPFLSPLYYVTRALSPSAEIRQPDADTSIAQLLENGLSMLVLADIGTISAKNRSAIEKWVDKGGVLVRFAGPRLAENAGLALADGDPRDPLIPVTLRRGGRSLGSALSWDEPQALAPFSPTSPLANITLDTEIKVRRQVLAEPDIDLAGNTWASLKDGTPLITAKSKGHGIVILVHVTANSSWSNLPLSGMFVDILERFLSLAPAVTSGKSMAKTTTGNDITSPFVPLSSLDGFGQPVPPLLDARPIKAADITKTKASPHHPPGLYKRGSSIAALNLKIAAKSLVPLATSLGAANLSDYKPAPALQLAGIFLTIAFVLFLLDSLAALFLMGGFEKLKTRRSTAALILIASAFISLTPDNVSAQTAAEKQAMLAVNETRFAYVITGDSNTDATSRAGLTGLNLALRRRTSVEPGTPQAINLETDEIVFYPLLYWPILAGTKPLSDKVVKKLKDYMAHGGTIFFDTRDQQASFATLTGSTSPQTRALRLILEKFDIPALEPVPPRHVLTRAFYLLQEFPGRWFGGRLWVEASTTDKSQNDGVSSIIIGANDYAAAWAINLRGQPIYPTIPGTPRQREFAYRTGINIVMYTLTGNYKADQVHIPALLKRLGQ